MNCRDRIHLDSSRFYCKCAWLILSSGNTSQSSAEHSCDSGPALWIQRDSQLKHFRHFLGWMTESCSSTPEMSSRCKNAKMWKWAAAVCVDWVLEVTSSQCKQCLFLRDSVEMWCQTLLSACCLEPQRPLQRQQGAAAQPAGGDAEGGGDSDMHHLISGVKKHPQMKLFDCLKNHI